METNILSFITNQRQIYQEFTEMQWVIFMQTTISKVELFLHEVISNHCSHLCTLILPNKKMDIKDGVTKLTFHYELSGATATDYNIYAFVLHEKDAEIDQQTGKLLLRA